MYLTDLLAYTLNPKDNGRLHFLTWLSLRLSLSLNFSLKT